MSYFPDIDTLQKSLAVNCSFSVESIEPSIELAALQYITPYIGDALYNDLITATAGTALTASNRVRRALANFAAYLHKDQGAVQWSDAGILRREGENYKSAYKYQEQNLQKSLHRQGWLWMELLLIYLENNEVDFPLWSQEGKAKNRALLINTATRFQEFVRISGGRELYEYLRPIIKDVECFAISPCIGSALYSEIKEQILTKTLSPANERLLPYLQAPTAYYTKARAIELGLAQYTLSGLVSIEQQGADYKNQEKAVHGVTASASIIFNDDMGNRHLAKLVDFLTKNIEDYPLYADFLAANTPVEEEEECSHRFPPCCGEDGYYDAGNNGTGEFISFL